MRCKICRKEAKTIFKAKILNKYNIQYCFCDYCGFLQTEEPFWLQEAYRESINISDTGYLQRNLYYSKKLTILLFMFFNKDGKFLDYAGGYGVFVRLMRDIGFDFYWEDKYSPNLFARGFEYNSSLKIDAITTFESFEHFVNPLEEIEKMLSVSRNIIFTTELLPNPIPKPDDWWYYGLDHGQHISFYSKETLQFIANNFDLKYFNSRNIHIFTESKSITNFKLNFLNHTNFGLHKLLAKKTLKSKTWEDYKYLKNLSNKK